MKLIIFLALSILSNMCIAFSSKAQTGHLDPSFSSDGIHRWSFDIVREIAEDIAVTSDGNLLVLINTTHIAAFTPDGNPDLSFGTNGVVQIFSEGYFAEGSLAVDATGRILVAKETADYYEPEVYLYRFLANGTPDPAFGIDGTIKTKLDYASNNGLLIQPDGKILVSGYVNNNGNSSEKASIQRFNENGDKDLTFGDEGRITLDISSAGTTEGMILDNSGRILVTGEIVDDVFLARILSNGTLDTGFALEGYAVTDNGGIEISRDVTVMADGRIVTTGMSATDFSSTFNCWRFLDDGSPDNSFGTAGLVKLDSGMCFSTGWFVFPDSDSTLIAGGSVFNGRTNEPRLYRMLEDGSVDLSFGNNGTSGQTYGSSVYMQTNAVRNSSGNIFVCGTKTENGNDQMALSAFLPNGLTDNTFGVNGTSSLIAGNYGNSYGSLSDLTILPDGRTLVTGNMNGRGLNISMITTEGEIDSSFGINGRVLVDGIGYSLSPAIASNEDYLYVVIYTDHVLEDLDFSWVAHNYSNIAAVKLHSDGTIDSSYGMNGVAQPEIPGYFLQPFQSVAVQSDGKLLIAGTTESEPGTEFDSYLVRLREDGSPDATFGNNGIKILNYAAYDQSPLIAALPNGKIVFAEFANPITKISLLLPDGAIDSSFGVNGFVSIPYSNIGGFRYVPILIQQDGKMIFTFYNPTPFTTYSLLRLNLDGSIDSTFGDNGISSAPQQVDFEYVHYVQEQPDGKILVAGNTTKTIVEQYASVMRLFSNGTIDSLFGTNGISRFDSSDININSMRLQQDGKIVVAGQKVFAKEYYVARLLNDLNVGISESESVGFLHLYPNPVTNILRMDYKGLVSNNAATVTITNVVGSVIMRETIKSTASSFEIETEKFPPGVYLITLRTVEGNYSAKFVRK